MRAARAALATGLLLAAGCLDDRATVARTIFTCNPASPTADADCGMGFRCYSELQSVGFSVCVPTCRPDDPKSCPNGSCTASGSCLRGCTVGESCPGSLSCVHNGTAPPGTTPNGLCLPIDGLCASDSDCQSPIFDVCTSGVDPVVSSLPTAAVGGDICGQGGCDGEGAACVPGSSCIRHVLPSSFSGAPDVCTTDCVRTTDPAGHAISECPPNFTCLSDALPQTRTRSCAPGFPGWLCTQPLGCAAGQCAEWPEIASGFKTCAPPCTGDDDCLPYDRDGNPNALSKFTCRRSACRSLQSLLFADLCLKPGDACQLDDTAQCRQLPLPSSPDAGAVNDCATAAFRRSANQPLGAFGGNTPFCVRHCDNDGDCATLTQRTHVPHACVDLGAGRACAPSLPLIVPCNDRSSCAGDLTCELVPITGQRGCTARCSTDDDCAKNAVLGAVFTCTQGLCLPRIPSGCPPPAPQPALCLSGAYDAAHDRCVSPAGWACDTDAQCQSGACTLGRCGG